MNMTSKMNKWAPMLSASFPFVCRIASSLPFITDGDCFQPATSPDDPMLSLTEQYTKINLLREAGGGSGGSHDGGARFETLFFPPFYHAGWDGWSIHAFLRPWAHFVYFVVEDGIILVKQLDRFVCGGREHLLYQR